MKVILQLIRHFWERGALTSHEVAYLLQHGFCRLKDVPGFKPEDVRAGAALEKVPAFTAEPPGHLELVEEALVRKATSRRRPPEDRGQILDIEEILERLRAEYRRRSRDLASLSSLAQRFDEIDGWSEAASLLHSVPVERFQAELRAGLGDESVLIGDLWQASDPEPFHRLIADDEVRGRDVRAFLALLIASRPDALGRHSWILRHDEAQAVMNLRVVHARLLASLREMFQAERLLLTHAIARNNDLEQVWSLVILYNAHRDPDLGDRPQYGTEYGPVDVPEFDVWREAWTCALQMDRPAVTWFLVDCYKDDREGSIGPAEQCRRPLMCPVGWHIPDR